MLFCLLLTHRMTDTLNVAPFRNCWLPLTLHQVKDANLEIIEEVLNPFSTNFYKVKVPLTLGEKVVNGFFLGTVPCRQF